MIFHSTTDTIVALATPAGTGAIGVVRLSGSMAIAICDEVFATKALKSKELQTKVANTIHFGVIHDADIIVDEVLVSLFKAPQSYTGQDVVEISCHGSPFIQQQVLSLLVRKGARMANPGEFTLRAFLNKKMDLSQAEAVADLIASNSEASHRLAMQQMRGGFSNEISHLRQQLIDFASLIELELDFAEEDVEFADRTQLKQLVLQIIAVTEGLSKSFETGNVIKNGIPVAIVGKPNAGKSTLLNVLLNEERAIVSEIAGTTRDTIEEAIQLDGVLYRFIDTAGIRETQDAVESIGVSRTHEKISQASIVVYLFDVNTTTKEALEKEVGQITQQMGNSATQQLIVVGNKMDGHNETTLREKYHSVSDTFFISAKTTTHIDSLTNEFLRLVNTDRLKNNDVIVTNARHAEALNNTTEALQRVYEDMNAYISGELLAQDIRMALYHLGLITGEVSTDNLLESIFTRFCIGK